MGMCEKCREVFAHTEMKDGYCKDCLVETNKENIEILKNYTEEDYDREMLEAFIGKPDKFLWYKKSFTKFNTNGISTMNWN
jgi:hypothetical protein